MSQPFQLCPDLGSLHAKERLNYVLGQVLGVKDFQQEQTYFLHKSQMQNRGLHGYGTVWGLEVSTEIGETGVEIKVSPGFAIDPLGREVTIEALQCANLSDWLAAAPSSSSGKTEGAEGAEDQPATNLEALTGEGDRRAVYVTLCYRLCETGAQPILGNPCRTDSGEEGAVQYTRIRDDFELQLRATPPQQSEEVRIREIAVLFSQIKIVSDSTLTDFDRDTVVSTLRSGIEGAEVELEEISLPQTQATDILRDLLRYWVTNVRPKLESEGEAEDDCLLLGVVTFSIDGTATDAPSIVADSLSVENSQRPYLLQTRLLQALLLTADRTAQASSTGGTVSVSVGSVSPGTPGTSPQVSNSGDAQNVVLDFVIPRGQPGSDGSGSPVKDVAKQLIIQPTDFLLRGEEEGIPEAREGPARLNHLNGYPSLVFDKGRGTALFSTLRPSGVSPDITPKLRLYCTAKESEGVTVIWRVVWRWRKSLRPNFQESDRDAINSSSLNLRNFNENRLETNLSGFRLHRSRNLELELGNENGSPEFDYLSVFLSSQTENTTEAVHLLMAELIWGEVEN